jgi:hypothetical protein
VQQEQVERLEREKNVAASELKQAREDFELEKRELVRIAEELRERQKADVCA